MKIREWDRWKKKNRLKKEMDKRSWFGRKEGQDRHEKDESLKELKDEKDMHKIDWDLEKEKDARLQELEDERKKREIRILIKKKKDL